MWDLDLVSIPQEKNKEQLLSELVNDLSFWGPLPLNEGNEEKASPVKETQQNETICEASTCTGKPVWRTAVDANSGKTYYYDAVSRKTQWEKPAEIRAMERQRKIDKKNQDRAFFKEMENNIRKRWAMGKVLPSPVMLEKKVAPEVQLPESNATPPVRARTISGMDEILLRELQPPSVPKFVVPKSRRDAHGRPPLMPARRSSSTLHPSESSLEFSPEESHKLVEMQHPLLQSEDNDLSAEMCDSLRGEALLDGPLEDEIATPTLVETAKNLQHVRRNTGGTTFAKSTMMNPDVEATIKCVCGVYRAHIVQASAKRSESSPTSVSSCIGKNAIDVFLDCQPSHEIPSLDEIITFYQDFYVRSQMEHDTIIMSLIYVERLIKGDTNIAPVPENWRSILFSCMVLASKVWDDLSMWNIDFSNVCGRGGGLSAYTLPRINQLELALLKALSFNVKVPASEYAKYYFLIRSMLLKTGLFSDAKLTNAKREKLPKTGHRMAQSLNGSQWKAIETDQHRGVCLEQLLSQTSY